MHVRRLLFCLVVLLCSTAVFAQVPSQNVDMVLGTSWPDGDPFVQRQNEPSMAVSSRNPQHLLAGSNDYRSVDIASTGSTEERGDAWLSVYTSLDGGDTWKSTLLPGYPQDTSTVGRNSPLHQFTTATDPTVRSGTHGLFYYSGLAFNRGSNAPSAVFVAVFQDQNNKSNGKGAIQTTQNGAGNPFQYISASLVNSGTSGQFLDKPWIAVDLPRAGRTATCNINGQTINSGYVYIFFTLFNGSDTNPSSKIYSSVSKDCGKTWAKPNVLSNGLKLAQGTVATIDPSTGRVYVFFRQIASGNQPDAIYYQYSDNGGNSFVYVSTPAYTFPSGMAFDQSSNGVTFRTLDFPAVAVDGNGKIWLAFSLRVIANGLPGSRIMMLTLPKGATTWTGPYQLDTTAPTAGNGATYGHQFMPSLAFVSGKLMAAWYDSRRDNELSTLVCKDGTTSCTIDNLISKDVIIQGSQLAATPPNPGAVFTKTISDPTAPPGLRHTIDVFGGYLDTTAAVASPTLKAVQVSQYVYWVDPADNVIKQGRFNVPNLPMFKDGTIPFEGDYIDIAVRDKVPDGAGGWTFNSLVSNSPVFHLTWADNRDVIPPPDNNWTLYVPPNNNLPWSGYPSSAYNGSGTVCPTCPKTQSACGTYAPGHSGDRNQNVYTAKFTAGLAVNFRENDKPLQGIPRVFSLNVRNTNSNLTNPNAFWYRIFLNPTIVSASQVNCTTAGGTATFANNPNCYSDVQVPPLTTVSRPIVVSGTNVAVNVLVAQITPNNIDNSGNFIPGTGVLIAGGLQGAVAINGDPSNPAVINPDLVGSNIALQSGYDPSNPDSSSPNAGLASITTNEYYDPTTDAPDATSPAVTSPAVTSPAVVSPAVVSPAVVSPAVVSPAVVSPAVTAVQYVSPAVVSPAVVSPAVVSPAVVSPAVVSPAVTSPAVTSLADSGITDFTWRLNNKGNTTNTYNAKQFAKAAGIECGGNSGHVCQLLVRKVTGTPTPNVTSGGATCDLTVSVQDQTVAAIDNPAFTTDVSTANSTDPGASTNPNVSIAAAEGLRVTLRVFGLNNGNAPPVPYKTVAVTTPDTGQTNAAASLTITTLELPVAVVGQPYTTNGSAATAGNTVTLASVGGFPGAVSWYVPMNAGTAQTPPPVSSTNIGGSGLTLLQSGKINPDVVSASPSTYNFDGQAQDTALPTPSIDLQLLSISVNRFSIAASVTTSDPNGHPNTTQYMRPGDVATVTVTVTSTGPSLAKNINVTVAPNSIVAGTQNPQGAAPVVNCVSQTAQPVMVQNGPIPVVFLCTAVSGNGYLTFTANATGNYMSLTGVYNTTATATTVYTPVQTPSANPPNVLVDTVNPKLAWSGPTTAPVGNDQGGATWYNTPVIETYTTSDNLSGVYLRLPVSPAKTADFANTQAIQIATEGKGITGQVTVTDVALNVAAGGGADSPTSPAFNIDMTKPTISGAPDRAANAAGWYKGPVIVTFTCNDPSPPQPPQAGATATPSGVASCTSHVVLSQDGFGQSVPGAVADYATNTNNTAVSGINIDQTLPTIIGAPDRAPNAYGWYQKPVTISFTCADPVPANPAPAPALPTPSGVASCTAPVILSSDGGSQSVPGAVNDNAGNANGTTVTGVNIDQTAPVIAAPTATAGGNPYTTGTWTNQNVVVTFTCSDNLSGPLVTTVPTIITNPIITGLPASGVSVNYSQSDSRHSTAVVTLTAETTASGVTLHANCQDFAGNNATQVDFGPVLIDKTPPTVTGSGGNYTQGQWTNQPVDVTFACSDALSGPVAASITGNAHLSGPQQTTVNGSCQDVAGNTGNGSFTVWIDTTPPGATITTPGPGQVFYLNDPTTPSFTCNDGMGGLDVANCTPSPFSTATVGPAVFTVNVTDQAGNVGSASTNYLVTYKFSGFAAPLLPAGTTAAPSNSGVFLKGAKISFQWQLQDFNNVSIIDPAALTSVIAYPNAACGGPASANGITLFSAGVAVGTNTYNAGNPYNFMWDTSGVATGCYNVVFTLNDTTSYATIVDITSQLVKIAPATGPGDPINSAFYLPSYPGTSLSQAVLSFSADTAGSYIFSLTAHSGAYDGTVIGTSQATVTLDGNKSDAVAASFTYPELAMAPGSTVAFVIQEVSGPANSNSFIAVSSCALDDMSDISCNAGPSVIETTDSSPSLSTFRRNGMGLQLFGSP